MGELEAKQSLQDMNLKTVGKTWMMMEGADDDMRDSASTGSFSDDSTNSAASSSFSELAEDASSSASSSSSSSPSSTVSNGPLFELSELMAHLPIKRGLSKFFEGKSQSFTSLASVKSIEDLAKKDTMVVRKRMKSCKSYGGGLDGHKPYMPKAAISKKASRGYFLSSLGKRGTNMSSCRPPISVLKG